MQQPIVVVVVVVVEHQCLQAKFLNIQILILL